MIWTTSAHVIARVRALIGRGDLSNRQIAKQLPIGRATVDRVANGTRPEPPPPEDLPAMGLAVAHPVHCSECGALLNVVPCYACEIRAARKRAHRSAVTAELPPADDLRLNLEPADRARYEAIRRRREETPQ
jgi:hypothetical protein